MNKAYIIACFLFCFCSTLVSAKEQMAKIIGGRLTSEHQFFAAIYTEDSPLLGCGASFISTQFIVTAAHCLQNLHSRVYVSIGYNETEQLTYLKIPVEAIIIHPKFNGNTLDGNDIALLKIKADNEYIKYIQPIALNKSDRLARGNDYRRIFSVLGIGNTTSVGDLFSNQLRKVDVDVFSKEKCTEFYNSQVLHDSIICAGKENGGADSCEGDSGGPLITLNTMETAPILVGIVSWGIGCGQRNKPGVYTRISSYIQWIEETMKFWTEPVHSLDAKTLTQMQESFCYSGVMLRNENQVDEMNLAYTDFRYTPAQNQNFQLEDAGSEKGIQVTASCDFEVMGQGLFKKFVERKADHSFQYVISGQSKRWIHSATEELDRIRLHCANLKDFIFNYTPNFSYLRFDNEVYLSQASTLVDLESDIQKYECRVGEHSAMFYKKQTSSGQKYFFQLFGDRFGNNSGKIFQMSKFSPAIFYIVNLAVNDQNNGTLSLKNISNMTAYSWVISCNFSFTLFDEFGMSYVAQKNKNEKYELKFLQPAQFHAIIEPQVDKVFRFNSQDELGVHSQCQVSNRGTEFHLRRN